MGGAAEGKRENTLLQVWRWQSSPQIICPVRTQNYFKAQNSKLFHSLKLQNLDQFGFESERFMTSLELTGEELTQFL